MAPAAKRRAETGLRCRMRKRLPTFNERWLHLSAGDVGVMDSLQSLMGSTSLVCTILNFQLVIALAVESVADGNTDMAAVNSVIDAVAMNLTTFLGLMGAWTAADSKLFDILHHEDEMTRQFAAPTNLRIDDLTDTACHKMTHFFHGQLRRFFTAFDLEGYLVQLDADMLPFYTGYTSPRSGSQCCYRIHPEEVFLFTMTKVATGLSNQWIVNMYIGGDYARLSFAYPWMIKYLDERYRDIIGHQALTRVIDQFPRFACAIERYLQRDHLHKLVNGSFVVIEGLEFSPWDAFAFIDNSINDCNVPYAGPRGNWPGAARREEYADAQQALYSGYTHRHGSEGGQSRRCLATLGGGPQQEQEEEEALDCLP